MAVDDRQPGGLLGLADRLLIDLRPPGHQLVVQTDGHVSSLRLVDVIDWLLEGDPAIRWQVLATSRMRRPRRSPPSGRGWSTRVGVPASWRSRTPTGCGTAAPASRRRTPEANPANRGRRRCTPCRPCRSSGWTRRRDAARRAIALIAEHGRWEHAGQRYFDGEVEPCINGRTIETGAYFGVDVSPIVERILGERLADGGWNCEVENGSVRSSFDTTIDVLDGLLEFERATGGSAAVSEARRSGEEYLLERSLFRRKSTGEVVDPAYLDFAFPYYWHYDVLRALDYFRMPAPNPILGWRRPSRWCGRSNSPTARWLLDRIHPGRVHFDIEDGVGRRAGGTPCAHCGCSTGGRRSRSARSDADGRERGSEEVDELVARRAVAEWWAPAGEVDGPGQRLRRRQGCR